MPPKVCETPSSALGARPKPGVAALMRKLPAELFSQVLGHLEGDASGRSALAALRCASHETRSWVDNAWLPQFHAERLTRKALCVGLAAPAGGLSTSEPDHLRVALRATRRLDIVVPLLKPASVFPPSSTSHDEFLRRYDERQALIARLGALIEIVAPVLGELSHVALRYERPLLLKAGKPLELTPARLGDAPDQLLIALAREARPLLQSLTVQHSDSVLHQALGQALAEAPNLERLEVSASVHWTLSHWRFPERLRELELSNSLIDSHALAYLSARMPLKLSHLGLAYNRLERAPQLRHLTQLRSLSLTALGCSELRPDPSFLCQLPPQLEMLQLVSPPSAAVLGDALERSSARQSLVTLNLLPYSPAPLGLFDRVDLGRRNSDSNVPEGCSPYPGMRLRGLLSLREVILPSAPAVSLDGTRRVDPHAHAMHWRRTEVLSRRPYTRDIFAISDDALLMRPAPAQQPAELITEPTWVFVDDKSHTRDLWPPSRIAAPSSLEHCNIGDVVTLSA